MDLPLAQMAEIVILLKELISGKTLSKNQLQELEKAIAPLTKSAMKELKQMVRDYDVAETDTRCKEAMGLLVKVESANESQS